jgi:hypothetical protein
MVTSEKNKICSVDMLLSLLTITTSNNCKQFKKKKIYQKILEIETIGKPFNYKEQEILKKKLQSSFYTFIEFLKTICNNLTLLEVVICCLSIMYNSKTISGCLGYPNTVNFRKHKNRIKKKLTIDSDNSLIFNFIFTKNENREL